MEEQTPMLLLFVQTLLILKMDAFKNENPDRFFQVGIAEANMMGIAAGLTIGGKIPFTGTFANFLQGVFMIKYVSL